MPHIPTSLSTQFVPLRSILRQCTTARFESELHYLLRVDLVAAVQRGTDPHQTDRDARPDFTASFSLGLRPNTPRAAPRSRWSEW
jgi:hypothetical protein